MSVLQYSPEEYAARKAAYAAVAKARRAGLINPEPCEVCGDPKTQGHHRWGYAPENALRLAWLCGMHHGGEHDRMRHEARGETLAPCLIRRCGNLVWATPHADRFRYCYRHMAAFIDGEAARLFPAAFREASA